MDIRSVIGRMRGGSPVEQIDTKSLYTVRVPNGDYVPGRILETHRLWERRWNDAVPRVSTEPKPSRTKGRVVGLLAVADRTVGRGRPDHLEALRQVPQLLLSSDPQEAERAVAGFFDELSRHGEPGRLGEWSVQALAVIRNVTVIDPRSIRPLE
ncbi:hypothetical protein WKI65_43725 [Streptomyces sp. MS1.AVA.3]|uniref:hypothetical protein n=1 Tax=Streptomyces decoyicus TaxID=249567 RepID=UPI0030C1ED0D